MNPYLKPVKLAPEDKDEIDAAAVVFVSKCLQHLGVAISAGEAVMWNVNQLSGTYRIIMVRVPPDDKPLSTLPPPR